MNHELSDVQAGFRKAEDQTANIFWIIGKAREFYFFFNDSTSALMTTPRPLTVWITTNCGKFFKR